MYSLTNVFSNNTKPFVILFALLIMTQLCFSQTLFKHHFDVNHLSQTYVTGLKADTSHFVLAGFTFDTTFRPTVMMTDTSGNSIWAAIFGESTHRNQPSVILKTNDNHFIVSGTRVRQPVGSVDSSFAMKLDWNGNIKWLKKFATITQDVIQLPNNNYLFVTLGSSSARFVELDTAGNYVNAINTKFGSSNYDLSIIKATSSGYYLTGTTHTPSGVNSPADLFLAKLDTAFNVQWATAYSDTTVSFADPTVIEASDGSIYISSYVGAYPLVITPTFTFDISLLKVSSIGNLLWNKRYHNGRNNNIARVRFTNDGNLLLTPKTYIYIGGTYPDDYKASVIKTDTSGNIIFQIRYNDVTPVYGFDVIPHHNNFYMLSHGYIVGSTGIADFRLSKLDNLCNSACNNTTENYTVSSIPLVPYTVAVTTPSGVNPGTMNIVSNTFLISYTDTVICTGATAISNVSLRDEIKLFPNPVTNQLTLTGLNSLSTISVKNLLGVNIFSDKTSNNNWHFNMDALVPGIYFITVEQKTSTVTLRVVKK